MKAKIDTKLDMRTVADILDNHGLSAGGKVQQHVTNGLIGMFNGYVPLRTGTLKGSATRNNAPPYEEIKYDGPYASRLYYNPQFNFNESPQRGAFWASRAWAAQKDKFLINLEGDIRKGNI